jgi:signal transduction histidine kinase
MAMNDAAVPHKLVDFLSAESWFSLAVYLVAHLAFATIERNLAVGAYDVALLCPAAGLLAAILMLSRRRRWPLLAAAAVVAELTASWLVGAEALRAADVIFAIAIPVEATAFALILTVFVPQPWFRRPSFEVFAYIVMAAMIAPLIGAFISSQYLAVTGASLREALGAFGAWWASDLLGMLLIIPAIFGTLLDIRVPGAATRRRYLTCGAVVLAWLGAITIFVGLPTGSLRWPAQADSSSGVIAILGLSVATVVWLTLTSTPAIMAIASMLAALLLNLFASAPGTVLGTYLSLDPFLLQFLYVVLITSSTASFVIALARFEQAHEDPLSHLRGTSGRLVAQIATRLSQSGPEDYRAAIRWSLGSVGRSCGADRCLVIETDEKTDTFSVTERWLREGVPDSSAQFQRIPLSTVADTFENILEGGSLFVIRDALPPGHPRRLLLDLAGARAAAYATIRGDGRVLGVVVLSWLKSTRRWTNETSILLQSTAQIIGSTLSRIRAANVERDYREKLRDLTEELARLDDQIRRETAADLHDGAAQSLAILRMRVAQLRRNPESTPAELHSLEEMIVTALSEIRGVIRNMAPASQFEFGMRYALREFVEQSNEQLDIRLSLEERGDVDAITGDVATLLYRASRELITNAIKHAHPSHVHVELACEDTQILLRVTDDGSGLSAPSRDPAASGSTGLGLFGLRERLRRFNGRIDTHSDHSGTRIDVVLSAIEQHTLPARRDTDLA